MDKPKKQYIHCEEPIELMRSSEAYSIGKDEGYNQCWDDREAWLNEVASEDNLDTIACKAMDEAVAKNQGWNVADITKAISKKLRGEK